MVTTLEERRRVLGKGAKVSNKYGMWTLLLVLETIRRLELTTLQERRIRGDLTETFKIMTQREVVDQRQFFQLST